MAKCLYIEIGVSQIRIVASSQSGKEGKVTEAFWVPTPQGAVEDGTIRDTKSVGERLREALAANDLSKVKKAVFTVFSSRIATRNVSIPFVKKNQIQSLVEANATEYFPIEASKYTITYQTLGVEENGGIKKYQLLVYASPKTISAGYLEVAETAGLVVEKIDYISNSIYQAYREQYKRGVHLIAKVEENSTLIIVLQDGELTLQRSLNYGIGPAIEAVQSFPVFGVELDYLDAYEVLRRENCIRPQMEYTEESRQPEDEEERMLEARLEITDSLRYLSGNILRILEYYVSRNAEREIESIVLAGMGAECRGLAELLGNELGMQIKAAEPERCGGFTLDVSDDGASSAFYLASIGSMFDPVSLMEQPAKFAFLKAGAKKQQEESLKGAFVVLGVSVAACLVLSVVAGGIYGVQYFKKKSLEKKIEVLQPVQDLYDQYVLAKQQHSDFLDMYDMTETPNEQLVSFLEELETKMPASINVSSFSSNGTGVEMSMTVGSKAEAAQVLIKLREFESLSDVSSEALSVDESGNVSLSVSLTYAVPASIGALDQAVE